MTDEYLDGIMKRVPRGEALNAKQELDPALVERACIAQEGGPELWDLMYPSGKVVRRAAMTRALLSLGIPATALNALWRGEAVVVNETTGLPYLDSAPTRSDR